MTPSALKATLGLALLAAIGVVACHKNNPGSPFFSTGPKPPSGGSVTYATGLREFNFGVPSAPGSLTAEVWYPAASHATERPVFYSSAYWGFGAPSAKLGVSGRAPLVLLAHGWRGTRFDLSWIGEALARQGYIVAAIDSPGSDALAYDTAQAPKMWYRANLLRELIDAVGSNAFFAGHVDLDHVAVIGHSAGGSTAFVLGGAQIDPTRFAARFPASAPVIDGPWAEPRIHAIVALNPGTGPAFTPEGLQHVFAPALILSGDKDYVAPEAQNARFYAENIPAARWELIHNADHYSFMPVCSFYGNLRHFGACIESVKEFDRAGMHAKALGLITAFLQQTMASGAHST